MLPYRGFAAHMKRAQGCFSTAEKFDPVTQIQTLCRLDKALEAVIRRPLSGAVRA